MRICGGKPVCVAAELFLRSVETKQNFVADLFFSERHKTTQKPWGEIFSSTTAEPNLDNDIVVFCLHNVEQEENLREVRKNEREKRKHGTSDEPSFLKWKVSECLLLESFS